MYKTYIETKHENHDRLGPSEKVTGWLFIDTSNFNALIEIII